MSKRRMQLQRAGYVLCLHHAQTAEEQPGPWEALPHPTIHLRLGCSLTRLEGSPVQEQHTGPCPALPWLSSSNNIRVHVLRPPSIPNTSAHSALISAGLGQVYELRLLWASLPLSLQVTLCPVLPPACHAAPASYGMRTEPLTFSAALI